jgi:para-nitrobenzyl esterase
VVSYRGIPYAASPVGELRFAPPKPPAGWVETRDSAHSGPAVPQGPSRLEAVMGSRVPDWDEDECLNLNVWAPIEASEAARRPVLVWFHGGGFTSGSGGWDWYDGAKLAALGDIVVVTANYRLGPLGYLYLPEIGADNLGAQDQIAVLNWVRDNIAAFGGDPHAITVGGQSAGAYSALNLAVAPDTRDLLHRVIAQSSPWTEPQEQAKAVETAAVYLRVLGIDNAADAGKELRELPVERLLDAYRELPTIIPPRPGDASPPMYPVLGGAGIPRSWRAAVRDAGLADKAVLLGTTADEASAFLAFNPLIQGLNRDQAVGVLTTIAGADAPVIYDRLATQRPGRTAAGVFTDFVTEQLFASGAAEIAAYAAHAYVYLFSRCSPDDKGLLGATHCADLPFLFNTFDAYPDALMLGTVDNHDRELGLAFGGALAAFVATGSPNGPSLAPWGRWRPGPAPEVMNFS